MTTSTAWQLDRAAAERYEEILTPVILGPFAQALVDFAGVQPGERVVDVGCGTGAAARYAANFAAASGEVIGIDINPGMIAVATAVTTASPHPLTWRVADATQLPLADSRVDLVLCAQSLQFMRGKAPLALAEMRRVLKSGGRVALSLWCAIEENRYFLTLVRAISRHIGIETASGLQSAFGLSDRTAMSDLLQNAGFRQVKTSVVRLDLPLPALREWIPHHISATPMAAGFCQAPAAAQEAVIEEVTTALCAYRRNGHVVVPFHSHIIGGRR